MADPRVIIIGAGPAGVRAAETLVEAGVRPIVVDEGARDGGQIYRRQPLGFTRRTPRSTAAKPQARRRCINIDRLKGQIDYRRAPSGVEHRQWTRAPRLRRCVASAMPL